MISALTVSDRGASSLKLDGDNELGLRHLLRDLVARYESYRARQTMRGFAPALHEATNRRWSDLREILGTKLFNVLAAKWRLGVGDWHPGDIPRRPRTAEEMALLLGTTPEEVREIDQSMVEIFAANEDLRSMPDWGELATVPIESAQAWWDEHYGSTFMPDGGFIPGMPQDFEERYLRKAQVDDAIRRAALSPPVGDALKFAWERTSDVGIVVHRGKPRVFCTVHDAATGERLVHEFGVTGLQAEYHPETGTVVAFPRTTGKD
jgi:hypothetical protein